MAPSDHQKWEEMKGRVEIYKHDLTNRRSWSVIVDGHEIRCAMTKRKAEYLRIGKILELCYESKKSKKNKVRNSTT